MIILLAKGNQNHIKSSIDIIVIYKGRPIILNIFDENFINCDCVSESFFIYFI